jgi:hypothetical protein
MTKKLTNRARVEDVNDLMQI